jgi:ABC-type multidrug transport system fused ATPase/permease subunit
MAKHDHIMIEEAFAQKRMSRTVLKRLIGYVRPYKRTFFLNLVFTLLATISQLLGPKFIQIGIDRYLSDFSNVEIAMRGILIVSAIYLGNLFWAGF